MYGMTLDDCDRCKVDAQFGVGRRAMWQVWFKHSRDDEWTPLGAIHALDEARKYIARLVELDRRLTHPSWLSIMLPQGEMP